MRKTIHNITVLFALLKCNDIIKLDSKYQIKVLLVMLIMHFRTLLFIYNVMKIYRFTEFLHQPLQIRNCWFLQKKYAHGTICHVPYWSHPKLTSTWMKSKSNLRFLWLFLSMLIGTFWKSNWYLLIVMQLYRKYYY